jgi:hypothetical protein
MRKRRGRSLRLFDYYRDHAADFVNDWGMTVDPRNIERHLPASIPFVLFPRQREWIDWLLERWVASEDGFTEKSRDMGLSWLIVGVSVTLCLSNDGMAIGFGSRKQEYVDLKGAPKAFFERARAFLSTLPEEFRGGFEGDSPFMRLAIPATRATINGEVGDEIGRGDRTSIYFVDETAFLEHPLLADAALSQTTNCRQDISTPNGTATTVAQKRRAMPAHRVFTFHWTQDPRKDQAWYDKELEDHGETIVAREIDINWSASIEGVLIPSTWARSAVGAAAKLGFAVSGARRAGLDVADEGVDLNAFAGRHGIEVRTLEEWSGRGGDIYDSVVRAFALCDEHGYPGFSYDADGLGAGVRGDARVINAKRRDDGRGHIHDEPFRGSAEVYDPAGEMVAERKNKDLFANLKAQSWWALRLRFRATHRAVTRGLPVNADEIVSISPTLKNLEKLLGELSQPTYSLNNVGKILVDKTPNGAKSPNLGDAVMIAYSPAAQWGEVWEKLAG